VIFCSKCGKALSPAIVKFCDNCGTQVNCVPSMQAGQQPFQPIRTVTPQYPPQPNIVKRDKKPLSAVLVAVLLIVSLLVGLVAGTFLVAPAVLDGGAEAATAQDARIEGSGFETAEDAVMAYLDALRETSLDGMISTFAIESHAENFDLVAQLERLQAFHPSIIFQGQLPTTTHFTTAIASHGRQAQVAGQIMMQHSTLFFPHLVDEGRPTVLDRDNVRRDAQRIVNELGSSSHEDVMRSMRFLSFVTLESVSAQAYQFYISEVNQENIRRNLDIIGAQKQENVIARVEIGNEVYLFFFEVVSYGDSWFISSLQGNHGILLGVSAFNGGVAPESYFR